MLRGQYFSTLERLRLAQDAAKPAAANSTRKRSFFNGRLRRPQTSTGLERGGATASPRRLQKAQSNRHNVHQAQVDASWFLTLPAKVQRRHFSREEQVLYAAAGEEIILDAADEALYKVNRTAPRSMLSIDSYDSHRTSWLCEVDDADTMTVDLGEEAEDSFRWMEEDDGLDLRLKLDDYHKHMVTSTTPSTDGRSKKTSFRRTLSLSSNPFSRTSTSSEAPPTPSIDKIHFRNSGRFMNVPTVKHVSKASTSTVDPDATYYQDPEARLKLRVYLASPQKFDEAIEFGFPSTDGTSHDGSSPRPKSSTKRSDATNDTQTFLRDDHASLFEDDEASLEEMDIPITPRETDTFRSTHRLPSSSKGNSTDSTAPSHLAVRKPSDSYAHALAGSREMTLRMTLTRPDLRADESTLYGWQHKGKDDPLALEGLPGLAEELEPESSPSTMMRGPFDGPDGWGPLPKEGGVKKLWKKVTTPGSSKKN